MFASTVKASRSVSKLLFVGLFDGDLHEIEQEIGCCCCCDEVWCELLAERFVRYELVGREGRPACHFVYTYDTNCTIISAKVRGRHEATMRNRNQSTMMEFTEGTTFLATTNLDRADLVPFHVVPNHYARNH